MDVAAAAELLRAGGPHPFRLRADPLFRARLAYCVPKGIPLSQFLSWSQADQDAALEFTAHEARRFPDGTHPDDWDETTGGSRKAFHTHVNVHPGARLIESALASEDYQQAGRGAHVHLVGGSAAACDRCTREQSTARQGD